jgi:hypothetical protein
MPQSEHAKPSSPDVADFALHFAKYRWAGKHALFGYPPDTYREFLWIDSLEGRFAWLRQNCRSQKTSAVYLVEEMIQWGGSQNGILQKFHDGMANVNLHEAMVRVIESLGDPEKAIESALRFPGLGLTYASKLLRFLDPDNYGALDSRICAALTERVETWKGIKFNSPGTQRKGYVMFITYLHDFKLQLEAQSIRRPECCLGGANARDVWRAADIEMALFQWAESSER